MDAKINKPPHLSEIVVHYTGALIFCLVVCALLSVALINVFQDPKLMHRAQTNNVAALTWALATFCLVWMSIAVMYVYSARIRSVDRKIYISRFFVSRRPQTIDSISEISEVQGRLGMGLRLGFKDGSHISLTAAAKNLDAFRERVKSI